MPPKKKKGEISAKKIFLTKEILITKQSQCRREKSIKEKTTIPQKDFEKRNRADNAEHHKI
jgi:hypothetical protein